MNLVIKKETCRQILFFAFHLMVLDQVNGPFKIPTKFILYERVERP